MICTCLQVQKTSVDSSELIVETNSTYIEICGLSPALLNWCPFLIESSVAAFSVVILLRPWHEERYRKSIFEWYLK